MSTKVETTVRTQRWVGVALTALLLLAAALIPAACGGGGGDKALLEKALAVFTDQDVAGAQEIFAEDATLYWNFSEPLVVSGINDISALIADYPTDVFLHGDTVNILDITADQDIQSLTVAYKGARFISAPVRAGRDLYMEVLEVRDGKIQNQYVEAMY